MQVHISPELGGKAEVPEQRQGWCGGYTPAFSSGISRGKTEALGKAQSRPAGEVSSQQPVCGLPGLFR